MVLRLLFGLVFLATVTGCATTGAVKTSQDQMQARVTDLEKRLEEKDSEIVDLQYQVKDISSKVSTPAAEVEESSSRTVSRSVSTLSDDVNRVGASVEDIQRALKNAGHYSGKIDGKLGPGTKQGILDFQKTQNLTADGILGKRTWKLLKSYLKE